MSPVVLAITTPGVPCEEMIVNGSAAEPIVVPGLAAGSSVTLRADTLVKVLPVASSKAPGAMRVTSPRLELILPMLRSPGPEN